MEDGGPSQTARRVAAHRLDFTRVPADYGDPAADQALAVDVAAGHRAPANRMHDYLAARTSFFDRVVVGALDHGVRQVVTGALRASLEPLAAGDPPPLFAGLEPYPDNWRASVRPPVILPHFPMVLHRGGYPDGS
jgi:hypothetical protein